MLLVSLLTHLQHSVILTCFSERITPTNSKEYVPNVLKLRPAKKDYQIPASTPPTPNNTYPPQKLEHVAVQISELTVGIFTQ